MLVKLVKNGTLVTMSGIDPTILANEMSYTHKETVMVPQVHPKSGAVYTREELQFKHVQLFVVHNESIIFQGGLLDRVKDGLEKRGIPYEVEDLRTDLYQPEWESLKRYFPTLQFRHKQELLISLFNVLDCGQLVAPTGFGKTFSIKVICALYPKARIVVTMPGADLVRSTYKDFLTIFGKKQVAKMGAGSSDSARITISTFRSLPKLSAHSVDILIVDEAHKAAASELARCLSQFVLAQKIFGFTATPTGRGDNAELVTESLLGPVRTTINYVQAVEHEAVVPVTVVFADVISGPNEDNFVQTVTKKRHLYWKNVWRNKVIAASTAKVIAELEGDPQVLILVDTAVHLNELTKLLPDYSLVYKSPGRTGLPKLKPKELNSLFDRFQSGELRRVIATGCWGTGVDFPGLDLLVMAAGSGSPIEIAQRAGRVTRLAPGKERGYVLDFNDTWSTWACGRARRRRTVYKRNGWDILSN